MSPERKNLFNDLRNNPIFGAFLEEMAEKAQERSTWNNEKTLGDWAKHTGFCQGIEFVLKNMGYDHDR